MVGPYSIKKSLQRSVSIIKPKWSTKNLHNKDLFFFIFFSFLFLLLSFFFYHFLLFYFLLFFFITFFYHFFTIPFYYFKSLAENRLIH
ncbi:hypothetical protein GLOIN_2v1146055 [Rhizophagus irregularis DAOM 181602=DAOM 197198]|uniref:Uncharacterized protein n=1 Tax=Rhizophagus irregularis (strain DAOM 181602 / DAOM 197198 / MUCL 43194) TaxID=747089 RepID=A0A2P4Q5B9_RHIID|nr:hypothetical protein GLOIN_2v1146055 [Rhizophagus irregularis DAOM 181602=DAOM 197198]POG72843.1 hypothetical protein GLOIN_2v1146055 [Rhizophagus irregularis DAOM 181602=DAOM 197198]GET49850.1 hypothetical protein GLOIN_2v1146055 [Rhizophagus irregularis DAOM 181602=DAOM 197198]|eukprot:XP_025179709.1 hypothetical protein GLOIN_2v1146055 [Rhizophagus irregularis DAOM 181602=DAOM 197198]